MLKQFYKICLISFLTMCAIMLPQVAHADAINYSALKYGTNETSMASGYYVKPATVTVNGDQYLVQMTIHTGTKLGKWPVTVLSIDGHGPSNVSKSQSASGYDYTYAFQTNNLDRIISSSISIDVPNVYVAKHQISFKFDTSNLPKLATSDKAAQKTNANSSSTPNKSSNSTANKTTKAHETTSTEQKKQAAQIKQLNEKNHQTQLAIIIGGIAAVVILSFSAFFFVKRK